METIRTYSELIKLSTFKDRFNYLKLSGSVGEATFGGHRMLNQKFYNSAQWKRVRDSVIVRDMGCDLGVSGMEISGAIYIHHMNPVTIDDFLNFKDHVLDPEYLICVSFNTHQAIHYGDCNILDQPLVVRKPNDTCLWKR